MKILIAIASLCALFVMSSVSAKASCDERYPMNCQVQKIEKQRVHHSASKVKAIQETAYKGKHRRGHVVILRGLMGEMLSPMTDLAEKLERRGYNVTLTSSGGDTNGANVVIAHSMGCFSALNSRARKIITIDCPAWARMALPAAPRGAKVANFFTLAHPQIRGAVNVPITATHINAPSVAQKMILSLL